MIDPIQTLKEYDRWRYKKDAEGHEHSATDGKFVSTGAAGSGSGKKSTGKSVGLISAEHGGKGKEYRITIGGKPLPEHLKKLRLPPAWTDVKIDPTPGAALVAKGRDKKGRSQAVYSAEHDMQQSAIKFKRIAELSKKLEQVIHDAGESNPEISDVVGLIRETGMRPGSSTDTQAEKQAYGATTLEGRHVVPQDDGTVRLQFVGKKGVQQDVHIRDKSIAENVKKRAQLAGESGKIFNTDSGKLRSLFKTFGGGGFKPKDLRTLKGTTMAHRLVKENPDPPKNEKEYKARVKEVAVVVSKQLGNTPTMALQAYIDPTVFHPWKIV